jgi:hypothetical protein
LAVKTTYAIGKRGGSNLMANVPQKLILRAIEHMVKSNRELHNSQTGTQMTTCLRHSEDSLGPDLVSQLLQFLQKKQTFEKKGFKNQRNEPTLQNCKDGY